MSSTVLLVAEDSFFLQNLTDSLKHLKASVVSAGSKHEALEVCSNHEVDLALLDIRQQGKDTMQVMARLKKNQPGAEVILLIAPENIALAMEGMQQGASDDIIVPFDVNQLKEKINRALKRRRAQLKASRKRTLLNTFQDAMVAATFAQAGEFETAQEIYADSAERSNRKKGTGR